MNAILHIIDVSKRGGIFVAVSLLPVRKSRKRKTTFTSGSRRRRRDAQHKEKVRRSSRRRRALLLLLLLLLLFSNARARAHQNCIDFDLVPQKKISLRRAMMSRLFDRSKEKEERYRTSPRFRLNGSDSTWRAPDRQANRRSVFPQRGNPPAGRPRTTTTLTTPCLKCQQTRRRTT